MLFPSWGNALVLQAGAALAARPPFDTTLAKFGGGIQVLPNIDTVRSTEELAALTTYIGTSGTFTMYSMDLSGTRTEAMNLQQPFYDQPENARLLSTSTPLRGAIHPRTYLLTFYRADALARLGAAVPDDWQQLLELLAAHREAVAPVRAAVADAAASGGGAAAAAAVVATAAAAGVPVHGMCLTAAAPACGRLGDVLAAIASTIVQTKGTQQGYVFDLAGQPHPATAVPLTNGTGWRYAATLLSQLLEFNAPAAAGGTPLLASGDLLRAAARKCPPVSPEFMAGSCLVTMEWDAVFPIMAASPVLRSPGVLRVAPLPGSRVVVPGAGSAGGDGTAELLLQPCSEVTCPLGLPHDLRYLGRGSNSSSSSAGSSGSSSSGSSRHLNRAPYSALLDLRAEVNTAQIGPAATVDIWNVLLELAGNVGFFFRESRQNMTNSARSAMGYSRPRDGSWDANAYARTEWWRVRPGDFNIAPFLAMGFDADTVQSYTRTLWHAVHHGNLALDLPSPLLLNWYRGALEWGAWKLLPNGSSSSTNSSSSSSSSGSNPKRRSLAADANGTAATPGSEAVVARETAVAAVLSDMTRFVSMVVEVHGAELVRSSYTSYIGGAPAGTGLPAPSAGDGGSGSRTGRDRLLAISIAVSLAVMLLGVVPLAVAAVYLRRHNRDLLGRVRAPRAGPDTTLLVSDVQNSTVLWESLDTAVMEEAMQRHHAVFRRLLPRHGGYETATEGDSFILAFYTPTSGCAFAADVQLALLEVDWPADLLLHPDGSELVVRIQPPPPPPQRASQLGMLQPTLSSKLGSAAAAAVSAVMAGSITGGGSSALRGALSNISMRSSRSPQQQQTLPQGYARPWSTAGGGGSGYGGISVLGGGGSGYGGAVASNASRMSGRQRFSAHSATAIPFTSGPVSSTDVPFGSSLSPVHSVSGRSRPGAIAVRTVSGDVLAFGRSSPSPRQSLSGKDTRFYAATATSSGPATYDSPVASSSTPAGPMGHPCVALNILELASRHQQQQQQLQQTYNHQSPFGSRRPASAPRSGSATLHLATPFDGMEQSYSSSTRSRLHGPGPLAESTEGGNTPQETVEQESSSRPGADPWRVRLGLGDNQFTNSSCRLSHDMTQDDLELDVNCTWREALAAAFLPIPAAAVDLQGVQQQQQLGAAQTQVCYRGLRVRMGLHSGLDSEQHIIFNKVSMTYKYYGAFADAANATNEAVPGGLIALSAAAFDRLKNARSSGGGSKAAVGALLTGVVIIYAGHHELKGGRPKPLVSAAGDAEGSAAAAAAMEAAAAAGSDGTPLYLALPRALVCRLPHSAPLRTSRELQLGSLWAPTGWVCIGFLKVVGATTLLSEIPAAAARALASFQSLVCRLLREAGGYLLEGGDGLVLVAFGSAAKAVEWALDCVEQLKEQPWEEELLAHELCEEVFTYNTPQDIINSRSNVQANTAERNAQEPRISAGGTAGPNPPRERRSHGGQVNASSLSATVRAGNCAASTMAKLGLDELVASRTVMYRGLRTKVGMDVGYASHTLGATSARIEYRGKVMNRAARIAGFASAGQVCVSADLWAAAEAGADLCDADRPVMGLGMGLVPLKGVPSGMEVLSCVRQRPVVPL